jgi:hypothetical protein
MNSQLERWEACGVRQTKECDVSAGEAKGVWLVQKPHQGPARQVLVLVPTCGTGPRQARVAL